MYDRHWMSLCAICSCPGKVCKVQYREELQRQHYEYCFVRRDPERNQHGIKIGMHNILLKGISSPSRLRDIRGIRGVRGKKGD